MEKTFFEDFMSFQKECETIPLDSIAKIAKYSFKYASLGSIIRIVRPILHKYNFIQHWECKKSGAVTCVLEHLNDGVITGISLQKNTHIKHSTVMIKSSDDPKQQGAAITYAKRYSLVALLGIVAEEDKDAPPNQTKNKPKLTTKAFEQAKDRIVKGEQNVTKQCLMHFDLTEKQNEELVNLDLEYTI